jgi:hypothetical protein
MEWPPVTIEEVTDPVEAARINAQLDRARKNGEWLSAHWPDLLPQARGKFVAVAGQEAYIADTPEEAWTWAEKTHPEDDGAMVQYVRTQLGPRIYANSRGLVAR